MKSAFRMAMWVVGLSLAASQSWGASATWTATGNGTVGYWTNNANWNATPYPGGGAGNNDTPTFNTVAGSSYTAILDATLPQPLGIFYCPDTAGSGSSRVIVTNCVLTMRGADPVVQFYRGFTLQIDAGGVITNVYQNCRYIWAGSDVTVAINNGGKLYGQMAFAAISPYPYLTGLVTCATTPGGIWEQGDRGFLIGANGTGGGYPNTNCLLRISGVTLTNTAHANFWYGNGASQPAVGNTVILENGAQFYQNSGRNFEIARTVGANGNVVQFGGTGTVSTINLSGNPAMVGYASAYNNSLIMTNANVIMSIHSIGGGGTADSNNALRVLAGATWNAKAATFTVGNSGAGPNNSLVVDGGTVTNVGGVNIGADQNSAVPVSGSSMTIQNGGVWNSVSSYAGGFVVGGYKGSCSNTLSLGGVGARSTVRVSMAEDGRVNVGGWSAGAQTNCNFNTLTVTNATVWMTNTFGAAYDGLRIGYGSASNTASICARADVNINGEIAYVGNGVTGSSAMGNLLTINNGALRGVSSLLVGRVAGDAGNSVLITEGGLLEANKLTILAGSTGNSISNNAGIYQFTTNNPTLAPVALANIAIDNGAVSFQGIINADVLCNQGGKPLDSTSKMAWSGSNVFRLNNATNATTGQSYTFTDGSGATNFCRLELLNGALYRGGTVTIGSHGSLVISNGVSTIASNLTFDSTASLAVDLSTTNGYGALVAQSDVTLNGCSLNINIGAAPIPGTSFSIISNSAGQTSGSFSSSSQVMTVNGTNYIFRINANAGGATVTCNLQTRGLCLIIE